MYKNKRKYKIKNTYKIFYISILLISLLIFFGILFFIYDRIKLNSIEDKMENNIKYDLKGINNQISLVDDVEVLGLIESIDYSNKNISLFSIDDNKNINFNINGSTKLKDKFGQSKILEEFKPGDIVNIKYSSKDQKVYSITVSKQVWEKRFIQNFKVDKKNNIITIGSNIFNYNDRLKIIYKNKNYSMDLLNDLSILNIKGIGNTIWYIEVLKGTGSVKIINADNIEKGILEIGPHNIISLDNNKDLSEKDIRLTEGSYKINLQGKNIKNYTKIIDVYDGEISILDLNEVEYTSGILSINSNVLNAKVTIDDEIIDISKPQILSYGEYVIKAELDGYLPFEKKINISEKTENIDIFLKKEEKDKILNILTTPSEAEVFIDDEYIGKSPLKITVKFGRRNLLIKKQGYLDVNIPFNVDENTDKYMITLIPNNFDVYKPTE